MAKPNGANAQVTSPRMIDMPPLSIRAEVVTPSTANDETREVEIVFTTGADVERYDWANDRRYVERLSLDPKHVRIDRLNAGGPLLDSHSAWSVSDMLGAVIPGSVSFSKNQIRARVRFSKREAVDGVWQDVKDGLVRSVSVGYRIYKYEETEAKGNKLPVRLATDWEPFEVSMVPIPADAGAMARGEKPADTNQCEILTRAEAAPSPQPSQPSKEHTPMEPTNDGRSEFVVEDNPLAPAPVTRTAPAVPTEPNESDAAVARERARSQGITLACRAARLPASTADKLIADGISLVDAQTRVFEELAKRGGDAAGPAPGPSGAGRLEVGDDPLVHARAGIENALLHRAAPTLKDADGKQKFPLQDIGRQYRGMGLMDIARAFLQARGIRTTGMSRLDIAGAALGLVQRGGMHTTSDFALLLADVQGKMLRAAYEEAPQTWQRLSRRVILPDFKPSKQLQLGDAPNLLAVEEHGEFTRGTIAEAKEQFALATFGRIFSITRQALINDDTDAFSRIPIEFGRAARRKESDLAWEQITLNGNMGDGVALFHATHGNLAGAGAVISVTTIGAGRAGLRLQKGLDGTTLLNLAPKYLVVPATQETVADQFVSTLLTAALASSVNPFAGRLEVISEPRLDANSTIAWYLAADPSQVDILLEGVLEGQDGPVIETRVGFDVDGIEIKARLDKAFKVADWRGLWKNPGA